MRSNRNALLLTLVLGTAFLGACSDQRNSTSKPHAFGKAWIVESASFHGDSFESKLLNCADCHEIKTFCTQCHFDPSGGADVRVPPGSGWVHGFPPPSHAFLEKYGDICNQCHTQLRGFGAGPASCHDCHGGQSPHLAGWVDPTNVNFHGVAALADLNSCKACHGADLLGGSAGVSCFRCHFGPDGTRQPPTVAPNVWTHASAKISHAALGLFTADQQTVCTTCHGLMKGFTQQPSFTDCTTATCHPTVLNYHGPDPSFFTRHPAQAHANIGLCRPCHDTPSPPPNFNGFVTGIACPSCHDQGVAHPPGPAGAPDWYLDHRSSGNRDTSCSICHNITSTLGPGPLPAAPGCFGLTTFNGQACHVNGPGAGAPHPVPYTDPTLHGPAAKGTPGFVFCQQCHANPPTGRSPAPRFNVAIGNLTAGCETCHADFTAHPSLQGRDGAHWYGATVTHRDAQNLTVSCALCHGANLEGDAGPACTLCHGSSPVTNQNCTSCHASPPNSTPADAAPNRQGAHALHNALPEVAGICGTCHNGGGTGTAQHFNTTKTPFLAVLSTFNAQTGGPATFAVTNAGTGDGTCSGVSCHGGKTTPNWLTGPPINVSTDCTKCHKAETSRTQYNSAVSGEHNLHVNSRGFPCTFCHDPAKLQLGSSHFANLKTTVMEGPASATVGGGSTAVTYVPATQSCTPSSTGACHGTRSWSGG